MEMIDIERSLIASVTTMEEYRELQAYAPHFQAAGDAFGVMERYVAQNGELPPQDIFVANFPDWDTFGGKFAYWKEQFESARLVTGARQIIMNSLEEIQSAPRDAIHHLVDELQGLGRFGSFALRSTDGSIEERYKRYQRRAKLMRDDPFRMWGIPTGLSVIDQTREGWMPGELIGFYSRPTVGKTWFLLHQGVQAWLAGKRVLLICPEMPESQVALRIDTLLAGHMGIDFSHRKLRQGHGDVEDAYRDLTEKVQSNDRWWTLDNIDGRHPTIEDIKAFYYRYEPDVVLIDGIYLIESGKTRQQQSWEIMKDVCYGLKTLATSTEAVFIVSHQKTRGTRRGAAEDAQGRGDDWTLPSLNDAAYGDAFVQAMSTILTFAPDREMEHIRWYSVRKSRERDIEWIPRMALAWDVDRGIISDLGKHGENIDAITQELAALGIEENGYFTE